LRLELSGCFVTGDTALLLTRSVIIPAGSGSTLTSTAIDVAHRAESGGWVYLIDNPEAVGFPSNRVAAEPRVLG
jgi:hypothetical protein